ncbi:MAG: cell division protein SepF [Clostridiales bacterium]|nr:cell division protein SepF [Clostridiales bacterium]
MGVFDLFGREPRVKTDSKLSVNTALNNDKEGFSSPVAVFAPTSYEDVAVIIDAIKKGKNAVVHLTELKTDTAIRVLDMLSGAIYALDGGVYEMQKNIFMFSPSGVELNK